MYHHHHLVMKSMYQYPHQNRIPVEILAAFSEVSNTKKINILDNLQQS